MKEAKNLPSVLGSLAVGCSFFCSFSFYASVCLSLFLLSLLLSLSLSLSQRVQVPNISGLWSQKPYPQWLLGPESLNIGYLDLLGLSLSFILKQPGRVLSAASSSSLPAGEASRCSRRSAGIADPEGPCNPMHVISYKGFEKTF